MGRLSDSATILCATHVLVLSYGVLSECLAAFGLGSRYPIGDYPTAKTMTYRNEN
jgi:hypothetical protein